MSGRSVITTGLRLRPLWEVTSEVTSEPSDFPTLPSPALPTIVKSPLPVLGMTTYCAAKVDVIVDGNHLTFSEDAIRNFYAYYATSVTSLVIDLYVSYPPVQGCVFGGEDKEPVEDTDRYEESLWDEATPVSQSLEEPHYVPKPGYASTQLLAAKIPITLLEPSAQIQVHPRAHLLFTTSRLVWLRQLFSHHRLPPSKM
ncbi:hypothetical protein PILCRDRAFT_12453 [Piloderma croceum F 1598]|uniref:Uncharacterized protein n=1 Tax=Piloderma croceum (strain F 1598) TaxID=765440 RepID=A0A0C3FB16_PILCF|nr:hypothetical protein PILCRDRAFT_12453 [Piloderma croceum F 1598]